MNDTAAKSPVDAELRRLERRLDELVTSVQQLKEENRALRHRQDNLISERANLLQKNEQVRARVEALTTNQTASTNNIPNVVRRNSHANG